MIGFNEMLLCNLRKRATLGLTSSFFYHIMLTRVNKKKGCRYMISKSLEEYLKTMYILKQKKGNIRVTDIAEEMNCSKASVNKAINNLKENGLVNYETYGTIEITAEGEDLSQKIIESYDIVFVFLKDVLGMESEKAEKEAENMKLSMSDETINKLAKYVHQVLGLRNLNCNYDVNQGKCRQCVKRVTHFGTLLNKNYKIR